MRTAEFIRPKEANILPCERRALHESGMRGKNGPQLRSAQLSLFTVLARSPQVLPLRRAGLPGVQSVGLVDCSWGQHQSGLREGVCVCVCVHVCVRACVQIVPALEPYN